MINETVKLSPQEKKIRRQRSIAIASILGALVALFYIVTFYKFGA